MTTLVLAIITVLYVDMPLWVKCGIVFTLGMDIASIAKRVSGND